MRGTEDGGIIRTQQPHIIFATFGDVDTHPHEIRFYSTNDDYGYMSNFAAYSFELDGTTWPTSEHYFQAMKFNDTTIQKNIRRLASPMLAARAGRDRKKPLRKDWESVKERIMYDAVLAKFTQTLTLLRNSSLPEMQSSSNTPPKIPTGQMAATVPGKIASA